MNDFSSSEISNSSDIISRQDAIDAMVRLVDTSKSLRCFDDAFAENPHIDAIIDELENLPSAEPERKTGKWIPFHSGVAGDIQYCSCCHIGCPERTAYCPHCGADMRGETDETD